VPHEGRYRARSFAAMTRTLIVRSSCRATTIYGCGCLNFLDDPHQPLDPGYYYWYSSNVSNDEGKGLFERRGAGNAPQGGSPEQSHTTTGMECQLTQRQTHLRRLSSEMRPNRSGARRRRLPVVAKERHVRAASSVCPLGAGERLTGADGEIGTASLTNQHGERQAPHSTWVFQFGSQGNHVRRRYAFEGYPSISGRGHVRPQAGIAGSEAVGLPRRSNCGNTSNAIRS